MGKMSFGPTGSPVNPTPVRIEVPKPVLVPKDHVVEVPNPVIKHVDLPVEKPNFVVLDSEPVVVERPAYKIVDVKTVIHKPVFEIVEEKQDVEKKTEWTSPATPTATSNWPLLVLGGIQLINLALQLWRH